MLICIGVICFGYPKAVLQFENKKVIFAISLVSIYFSVALPIIIWGFDRPIKDAPDISFGILFGTIFLIFMTKWIHSRRKSGRVLLDIGSMPNRFAYVVLSIIFILVGFIGDFFYFLGTPWARYISIALGFSFAIWSLIMATGRVQICQKGILVYWYLQTWKQIESYNLHYDGKGHILQLLYKGRIPVFLRNDKLLIPFAKKSKLESLLKLHCQKNISREKHLPKGAIKG